VALIKCPECSREISDKAETCPQCAYPVSSYACIGANSVNTKWIEEERQSLKSNKILDEWDSQAGSLDAAMGGGNAKAINSGGNSSKIGIILLIAGLAFGIYSYQMVTTITTESKSFGYGIEIPSMTVNNLGLMEDRRNNLMISGVIVLVGAIFAAIGGKSK
jgi:hypothetical protein